MAKLLNRQMIQYIKQGHVLYGQNGLDFDDRYFWRDSIRSKFNELYKNKYPNPTNQSMKEAFDKFLNENFINHGGYYYNVNKGSGKRLKKGMELENSMVPVKGYEGYFRDKNGQLWEYRTYNKNNKFSDDDFLSYKDNDYYYHKVSQDIVDHKTRIPSMLSNKKVTTASNDPDDLVADKDEIKGYAGFHKYDPDDVYYYNVDLGNGKHRWAGRYKNPSKDKKTGWYWIKPGSTGYNRDGIQKKLNENNEWVDVTGDDILTQLEQEAGVQRSENNSNSETSSENNTEVSTVSEFKPVETEVREFKPSIAAPTNNNNQYRLVRRSTTPTVARPTDMPLMNRADVRYTISDVTKGSPYGSSDIELVNSLANTPDSNMFKQALMNRLGMSKWDNTTALNRLNYLGVKGHIGGSDRKRLRNLINKGTTVNGKIRK